ncbi:MAG: hypothetical protein QXL16_02705, partial [Candidatus Micrarchaeaceae archaeon]
TYARLKEKGIIVVPTIVMQRIPYKQLAFIYAIQTNMPEFYKGEIDYLNSIIEETPYPTDKYALMTYAPAPYGDILIQPLYETTIYQEVERIMSLNKGIEVEWSIITQELVGQLGFGKTRKEDTFLYEEIKRLTEEKKWKEKGNKR